MIKTGNFEQYIDQKVNRVYAKEGIAMVHKIATPTQRRDGQLVYSQKSTVDFIGILDGGTLIAFDTKETKDDVLRMQMIKPHQVEYLTKVAAYGGLAFLLIRIGKPARYFKLELGYEWRIAHWDKRRSMAIADLERLGVEREEGWYLGKI